MHFDIYYIKIIYFKKPRRLTIWKEGVVPKSVGDREVN
jgi:hypothetical protein